MYLHKKQIMKLLHENKLIIRPLLDEAEQIGELTIDFRLGTDFLISTQGRDPYIDATCSNNDVRPVQSFFLTTRRKFGEEILLHPNQTVLCSSLEYVKLPENVFATLSMRSSYSRLGLSVSTIVQAGYCGCMSIELTNVNNNPIKVAVGARIFQARLYKIDEDLTYSYATRKYVGQVRPIPSVIDADEDLKLLNRIKNK